MRTIFGLLLLSGLLSGQITVPNGCQVVSTSSTGVTFTPCAPPPPPPPQLDYSAECVAAPTGLPALPAGVGAELPRSCPHIVYPAPSTTVTVSSFADLQSAVNTAATACDTRIVMTTGLQYPGNLKIPAGQLTAQVKTSVLRRAWNVIRRQATPMATVNVSCAVHPNLIESANINALPARHYPDKSLAGTAAVPTLVGTASSTPALTVSDNAQGWYFSGLEVTLAQSATFVYPIIGMGEGTTTVGALPQNIVFDRILVHPAPCIADSMSVPCNHVARGIDLNAVNSAVLYSNIYDIVAPGQDTQAINVNNSTGPGLIAGNNLEASGENLMFNTECTITTPGQGSTGWVTGDIGIPTCPVPSDFTVRLNHFRKLLAWQSLPSGCSAAAAQCYTVKNLTEVKHGARLLQDSNVLDTTFAGGQAGAIISNCFYSGIYVCRDWTFTNNLIEHVPQVGAVSGNGQPALCGASNQPACGTSPIQAGVGFTFRNNLAVDVDGIKYGGVNCNASTGQGCPSGIAFQLQNTSNAVFDHYTILNKPSLYQNGLNFTDQPPSTDQGLRASYGFLFGNPFANAMNPGGAIAALPSPYFSGTVFVGDYWQHPSIWGISNLPTYPTGIYSLVSSVLPAGVAPVPAGSPAAGQSPCSYNNYPIAACWPLDWAMVGFVDFAGCSAGTNLAGCALAPGSQFSKMDNGIDAGANIPALLSAIANVK